MEVLFQNKHIRDKEWAKDINRYIYFKRPILIVIYILCVLYVFSGILMLIFEQFFDFKLFIFPLLIFAFNLLVYNRNVNLLLKRDLEMCGVTIEVTATVTDEAIMHVMSSGAQYILNYADIKKVVETKKYIYLWSKTNMLYSFKKDSFSVGDEEGFKAFLRNKGFKIK